MSIQANVPGIPWTFSQLRPRQRIKPYRPKTCHELPSPALVQNGATYYRPGGNWENRSEDRSSGALSEHLYLAPLEKYCKE